MSILRLHALSLLIATACATGDPDAPLVPDPVPVPLDPAGRFEVRSTFALAAPPAITAPVFAALHAATDDPDDPSRFLIDLVVSRLPTGNLKTTAQALAPYVAAYVNLHLADVAPRLLDGLHALTSGFEQAAQRFGTLEAITIDDSGRARRTVRGYRFGAADVELAAVGLPELTVETRIVLDGDRLAITDHELPLPYGQVLRLGLDRAVIPAVVPACAELACAFRVLVDCPKLGELIAARVGVGTAGVYAQACSIGVTAAANAIYDRMPAFDGAPLALQTAGSARAVDLDRDGPIDAIEAGTWTGTLDGEPLGAASFAGTAAAK